MIRKELTANERHQRRKSELRERETALMMGKPFIRKRNKNNKAKG